MSMEVTFQELIGKTVLITGDVGVGKTKFTLNLLKEAIDLGLRETITILDMAPTTVYIQGMKVGGKLLEFSESLQHLRYLTPFKVETPRLSARSKSELLHLVSLNEQRIRPLLYEFVNSPTSILFINDVSLYLQSGKIQPLLSAIQAAKTCIINGYLGKAIQSTYGTEVSRIEKELMEQLADSVNHVIQL